MSAFAFEPCLALDIRPFELRVAAPLGREVDGKYLFDVVMAAARMADLGNQEVIVELLLSMIIPLLFEEEHELHINARGVKFRAAQGGAKEGNAVRLSASLQSSGGGKSKDEENSEVAISFGDHLLVFLNSILAMVEASGAYLG